MKVIAYTALHYGRDYLAYAIRSVIDHVDEYHVLYTSIGSHGHRTERPCPETRDELYAIAAGVAGVKLHWHEGEWPYEGAQRDMIFRVAPDADVIVTLDADEIWPLPVVLSAIGQYSEALLIGCKTWRVPIIHFWRSFHKAVLHDPAYPVRVIFPQIKHTWDGDSYVNWYGVEARYINHMGYAQRPEIIEYKQHTHGHKNEWRRDVDWFKDVFMANRQYDCHPVGSEYWNPETVNPWDYLPDWMKTHPYANREVIE